MAGDFEQVYRRFGPPVHAYLVRLTGNRSTAEEICQETFVRYLERRDELRNANGSLGPWLYRVATNLATDFLRRRRPVALEEEPPSPSTPDPADAADLRERIRRELARLPDDLRAAFLLHAHEGLTHQEAAGALGVSERTAKERFRLAREILAHRLEERP